MIYCEDMQEKVQAILCCKLVELLQIYLNERVWDISQTLFGLIVLPDNLRFFGVIRMKLLKIYVFSIMIAMLMCGCSFAQEFSHSTEATGIFTDVLTEDMKHEIEDAWLQTHNHPIAWMLMDGKAYSDGIRYYGTYNGYTILFESGNLTAFSGYRVGDIYFNHVYSCTMYAYYDGQFLDLNETYLSGYISEKHIQQIKQKHVEIQKSLYNFEYDW
jgi:hypothetical protein